MKFRKLGVETLEKRVVLDAGVAGLASGELIDYAAERTYEPLIVAGDPNGNPSDSPADRVTTGFPGVGSLFIRRGRFTGFICTATLISQRHVLTAGHCLDTNDDGLPDGKARNVSFYVNGDTSTDHTFVASALIINDQFTGFANPVVNDDIAIVTLNEPVPSSLATPYALYPGTVSTGSVLEMVGFGRSGNGVVGYTTNASLTVKRLGYNAADVFGADDEGSGAIEVWEGDFDHPTQSVGYQVGADSLGNHLETNLGSGDSGGPSFINGQLAAINTYGFSYGSIASPKFGTGLGGILVEPYVDWIGGVLDGSIGGGGGGKGKGGGKGNGGGRRISEETLWFNDLELSVSLSATTALDHGATFEKPDRIRRVAHPIDESSETAQDRPRVSAPADTASNPAGHHGLTREFETLDQFFLGFDGEPRDSLEIRLANLAEGDLVE